MYYCKKPVVIEAIRWTGSNLDDIQCFVGSAFTYDKKLIIHTLEGDHEAKVGDYIIKGVQGEFYPCKPDIFAATYEAVEYPTCNYGTMRDMELSRKTHREF